MDSKYDELLTKLIKRNLLKLPDETEPFIEKEIEFIKKSLLECFRFILENDILRHPQEFNEGKIYRAGLLRDVDKSFIPLGKAISKNCGVKDDNEAVWFSSSNIDIYIRERIKNAGEKVYGIQTCKTFKSNKSSFFINLSSKKTQLCEGTPTFLLNQYLQFLFNKCLIVPLIRNYSSDYAYTNNIEIEGFEDCAIFGNKTIIIDKHVPGYPCTGTMTYETTIYDVFRAWDSNTGTRNSFLNEDRIQITLLFQLIDIFNQLLKHKKDNIQILGWTCENTPTSECNLFHSELAIAIKYLQNPLREFIFEKDNKDCTVEIIDPDSSTGGDGTPDYIEMNVSRSSRNESNTPDELDHQLNNYTKDPMFSDTVIDKKIEDINEFLFNLKEIRREISIGGGRKMSRKRKIKSKRKSKRKLMGKSKRKHRKRVLQVKRLTRRNIFQRQFRYLSQLL